MPQDSQWPMSFLVPTCLNVSASDASGIWEIMSVVMGIIILGAGIFNLALQLPTENPASGPSPGNSKAHASLRHASNVKQINSKRKIEATGDESKAHACDCERRPRPDILGHKPSMQTSRHFHQTTYYEERLCPTIGRRAVTGTCFDVFFWVGGTETRTVMLPRCAENACRRPNVQTKDQ